MEDRLEVSESLDCEVVPCMSDWMGLPEGLRGCCAGSFRRWRKPDTFMVTEKGEILGSIEAVSVWSR